MNIRYSYRWRYGRYTYLKLISYFWYLVRYCCLGRWIFYQRLATVIYDDTAVNRPKYLNIFWIHFQHRYQHHHRCWFSLRNVHFNELSTYIPSENTWILWAMWQRNLKHSEPTKKIIGILYLWCQSRKMFQFRILECRYPMRLGIHLMEQVHFLGCQGFFLECDIDDVIWLLSFQS